MAKKQSADQLLDSNEKKMQEIDCKLAELKDKFKCEIYPIVCKSPETKEIIAIGYLKEPSLQVSMAYMDLCTRAPFSAGESVLSVCIIKGESDSRLYTPLNENKMFYLTAVSEAGNMITLYQNQFKKK